MGEGALALALRLSKKHPEKASAILSLVAGTTNGVWYYTPLSLEGFDNEMDAVVSELKELLQNSGLTPSKLLTPAAATLPATPGTALQGLRVAYYAPAETRAVLELIRHAKATPVITGREEGFSGYATGALNPDVFLKAAGTLLADAYDQGAHCLITPHDDLAALINKSHKKIQCLIGRELPLPVLTATQFYELSQNGNTKALGKLAVTLNLDGITAA